MASRIKKEAERFHDCPMMESTEWEYYGFQRRSSGMSAAYGEYTYAKKRYRALVEKIKKRIYEIVTSDEPLKCLLYSDLKLLDNEVKGISPKNNNDMEIIANLFRFIAHLLGWAYLDGKFHRTPIYYQTKDQQVEALRKSAQIISAEGLFERFYRRRIIKDLLSKGLSHSKIALILSLTESSVRHLDKAEYIDQKYKEILDRIKKKMPWGLKDYS